MAAQPPSSCWLASSPLRADPDQHGSLLPRAVSLSTLALTGQAVLVASLGPARPSWLAASHLGFRLPSHLTSPVSWCVDEAATVVAH